MHTRLPVSGAVAVVVAVVLAVLLVVGGTASAPIIAREAMIFKLSTGQDSFRVRSSPPSNGGGFSRPSWLCDSGAGGSGDDDDDGADDDDDNDDDDNSDDVGGDSDDVDDAAAAGCGRASVAKLAMMAVSVQTSTFASCGERSTAIGPQLAVTLEPTPAVSSSVQAPA